MEHDKLFTELMDAWTHDISHNPAHHAPFLPKEGQKAALEQIQDALRLRCLTERQVIPLARRLWNCLFGRELFQYLLSDPLVSDIKILSYNQIRLKCLGLRKDSPVAFQNPGQYLQFLNYLLAQNGLRLEDSQAFISFCDADSHPEDLLCFHVSSKRINSKNLPYLHLRRIPKEKKHLEDLTASGMLNEQAAQYLTFQARHGSCILFTGNSRNSQSLLLNALIDLIPHGRSALAIQEQEELFSLSHPEIMFQHTVPHTFGSTSYDTRELMEYGLLLDSDYFILDELKPENVLPFWKAVSAGCRCWTRVPGKNASQAVECLSHYLCLETSCPKEIILPSLSRISCVVSMEGDCLKELIEVKGWDEKKQRLELGSPFETAPS